MPLRLPLLAGGAVGVPISVWALPHMNPAHVELALGTMLLACCPVNVSVWRDVASLNTCVCGSVHVEPMRRRACAAPGPVVADMPGSFSAERPAT